MNTLKICVMTLILIRMMTPFQVEAGEGFYAGASVGTASLDDDFDGLEIDDDVTAYRIVGGWWVNRYLALEAGYHDFGDFEQSVNFNGASSKAKLSADGYTLGLQASYPLGNKVALFGRAGAFFWDGEAEINNVSQASPEETNPYLSLGLSYSFTNNLSVNGDWTHYDLESSSSDVFSLGFQFRFGR
ncbi:MAG: outer membrane beta-barrel protein [Halieaceae bacterium]